MRTRRVRDERGYATMFVLGIVVLLSALALVLIGAARSAQTASLGNARFLETRQHLDYGYGAALAAINDTTGPFPGAAARSDWEDTSGQRLWEWATDPSTRTLTVTGRMDDRSDTNRYQLRGKSVGSWIRRDGDYAYGVTANRTQADTQPVDEGLWGAAAVSTSAGASVFDAELAPTTVWNAFGATQVDTRETNRAVRYSPDAEVGVTADRSPVSTLAAYMDEQQLDHLLDQVATPGVCDGGHDASFLFDSDGTADQWRCHDGSYTLPAGTPAWAGVRTLVVNGNLTLPHDINTGTGQLHVYVNGNVHIDGAGVRNLDGVFLYAPRGTCRTRTASGLTLTGSVACRAVLLPAPASVTHEQPLPANATRAPYVGFGTDTVYYAESNAFRDHWN